MRNYPVPVILLISIFLVTTINAQRWTPTEPLSISNVGIRDIVPQEFVLYNTDDAAIREILWNAPDEEQQSLSSSNTLLTIGLADGTADVFRIVKYEMMETELAAAYSDIRTIRGISISNPYRTIRADWTTNGFRAVIRDLEGTTYIDPYQRNDLANRIVYYKKDFQRIGEWTCDFENQPFDSEHAQPRVFGDCMFRGYKLAVATTGEYSNHFGATSSAQSAIVLAEVVTAVNRVNEVYEADVAVRLVLIGNTADVFYYNPSTDPYSGSACTQLGQNQTTLDNVIGSANYDVGHVFSVGSGGCAGLGVICSNGNKGRGATGLNPPTGDPFYIDYVAHELGHQFGGSHTFNGTTGSCSGNRTATSAYEPGSGSTIQAYAGICGAQDLQPNSDDYFHARSLLQISNKVTSTNCHSLITFNNTAPVAGSPPNYTIPISTPFVLTANASDGNNDPLTYCWEQYDLEEPASEPPASNDTDGPLFRSFKPVSIPERYFPRLLDLTQNITPVWEVLPSVTRAMTFRMTVRDYHNVAGCTDEDDVVVTANSTAGPFIVTSQNSGATWLEGTTQTITWNVANTTAAPVSCPNVDIRLSYDGGFTYPQALLLNETNDGSATVTIPIGVTTDGRVMVKGSNNIFFDINNADIIIEANLPNFTMALNPTSVSECNDGSVQTTVIVGSFMGFSNPVTLSLLNPPPGAIATFVPPVVIPGNNSTLTINNLNGLFGTYVPIVRGTSSTGNKDVNFTINLSLSAPVAPSLTIPANHQLDVDLRPTLIWTTVPMTNTYEFQIATSSNFNPVLISGSTTTTQVLINTLLASETNYYWRIRGINFCGPGAWSAVFDFKTMACISQMSTNVPVPIPSNGAPTVTSNLPIAENVNILDMNVITLVGTHTYVDDLKFTLIAPNATEVLIWDRPCGNHDNFNINFDDEAENMNWPCPPTNGLTYKPNNAMSPYTGLGSTGTWVLKIQDIANNDGGSLTSWGLRVCYTGACQLLVSQTTGSGPGSLPAAVACATQGDTVLLSSSLSGQTINVGASPIQLNKSLSIIAQAPNINITSSGTRPFEVSGGTTVEMNGMIITAGTSMTGGAIQNQGNLTLKNVTIERNTGVSGATLIHNSVGILQMVGSCSINQ